MTEWLLRALGAALLGALIAAGLKKESPAMAFAMGLAAVSALGFILLTGVELLKSEVSRYYITIPLSETLLSSMLRVTVASVVTKVTADICRDAGQSAVGYVLEVCGTICAMILALPAFRGLYETIENMF